MDRETVVSSLFDSVSRKKRDRDHNVVQTLRKKAELAVKGEKKVEQKIYEAEADVKIMHCEKEIQILLFRRSIRSSRDNELVW